MKKFLVSVLAIAGLVACNNEQTIVQQGPAPMEFAGAFVENATRANDPSITTGTLSAFDVWAYVEEKAGTVLTKERVTKSGEVWTYSNKQYWTPNHNYYFTAIAPVDTNHWTYNQAEDELYFSNGVVAGAEDLIYAYEKVTTPATINQAMPAVALQFEHLLSKVNFKFKNGFATENVSIVVKDVQMTAPAAGTYQIAGAGQNDTTTGEWILGEGSVDLVFGDVVQLSNGASASAANERLTIPASAQQSYTVSFTVELYNGTVMVQSFDKVSTITGVELEKGKAYNFVAEITPENLDLTSIEFALEKVAGWDTTSGGSVEPGVVNHVSTADEFNAAIDNPEVGTIVLAEDITLDGTLVFGAPVTRASTDLPGRDIVIDGNGKTLKVVKQGTGRVIDFTKETKGANLTLKNLTIENNVSWIERIVNYNTNGTLTLDNVKIVNAEGCSNNYAINLPGKSAMAQVVIKNSEIWAGAIALNLWGDHTRADVTNSKLYVVDKNPVEGYSVVSLNNDGENAAHYSVVNVEGGELKVIYEGEGETMPSSAFRDATVGSTLNISETTVVVGEIKIPVANVIYEGYNQFYSFSTVDAAIAKVQEDKNGKVVLFKDLELTKPIKVEASEHEVVLDLNGYTITGTDNTTANYGLIQNNGVLTINDSVGTGKLVVSATTDSGTARYSAVISNNPGAKLVINGGTLEHLGGTYMAYGIDNLTNGNLGNVECTINGGTIKSTYRAVRQFLNSDSCLNALVINGGILDGVNKSLFFHDPSKKANKGKLVVNDGQLKGDVYLYVTEGSDKWPVEVSLASAALTEGSKVTYKNVPAGYAVVERDGVWTVIDNAVCVGTVEELNKLRATNAYVVLTADIDFKGAAMTKPIEIWGNSTFDGQGHKISNVKTAVQGGYATSLFRGDACDGNKVVKNLVIENLTTPAGYSYASAVWSDLQGANIEIDNVVISNATIEATGTIGGFVGFVSASTTSVVIKNSSINNSNLNGGEADHKRGAVVGRAYGCTVTCSDVVVDNVKINGVAATASTLVGDKGYTGTVTVK